MISYMLHYYTSYTWEKGKPKGFQVTPSQEGTYYLILSDPYGKRFIIEEHNNGCFSRAIYDSSLFDFRYLHPRHQVGWMNETLFEKEEEMQLLVRDREHIPLYTEKHSFRDGKCIKCELSTPHGIHFATQKVSYTSFGDPFNGVTLHDAIGVTIMYKKYKIDAEGEFSTLEQECWSPT